MTLPRLNAGRVALVLSALALLIAATGVTPSDAARAVARALNANKVDGISASRTPKAGQLVPLGKDRRFPLSVIPGSSSRGPRGPQGPAGATGDQGPSEGYIARSGASPFGIPFGVQTTFATLTVPAGAYALSFSSHAYSGAGSTFVDCNLTANGALVSHTAVNIGVDPRAVLEGVLAITEAARFAIPTVVRVVCSKREDQPAVQIVDINLSAIRLGSLTVQ